MIQRAPRFQRLQQHLFVFNRNRFVEPALRGRLGKQLGDLALKIRLDVANTLRLSAERAGSMQKAL